MPKKLIPQFLRVAAVSAFFILPALAADDIEKRVQVCGACHGPKGSPTMTIAPVIWGQQASYLYRELHDYHSGARPNTVMAPLVKNFKLDDLREIANYFAGKTWPARQAAENSTTAPESASACHACHGQNFEGSAMAPRLAGLSYEYLIGTMNAFADDRRTNNEDMPKFMKALDSSQREAIAHYLASL